jgi:non-ribosomal peptide synthetase-like protein
MLAIPSGVVLGMLLLTVAAWWRYRTVAEQARADVGDTCRFSLTDRFSDHHLVNAPHQRGVRWLCEVFARTAARYPDHPALEVPHTGERLTYAELDRAAERVAAVVQPFLTGPDQVVAVAMPQDSSHIVAAHLGVLRAGGVMLFLDTAAPEPLIEHMLTDAAPVLVLTRGEAAFRDWPTVDVASLPEPRRAVRPPAWLDDPTKRLAALFYTSGTTGRPKGVECPHAGSINLALSYADAFDLVPGFDATTLTSSLGYDGSISEMYSAWVSGCTVVLLTKDEVRSGPDLVPILANTEVTVLFCPPVLLTTLTARPEVDLPYPLCRFIVPAGEAFPPALVEPWTRGRRQIINTYGPTEASTDTSRQSLRPGQPVTIGSPFPNVIYVILEEGGLAERPHGETGELCIGGVHLARGYRNLPEQTAEKFIEHPRFGRLYRTGDRCQIDPVLQQVHFLGRVDAQLKVRGHRVEIQPIEDLLQTRFPEIESAVVDYQEEELIAFVVAGGLAAEFLPIDRDCVAAPAAWARRVLACVAAELPEPSVPSRLFLVRSFTLKPLSGKIDRALLPRIDKLTRAAGSGHASLTAAAEQKTVSEDDRPPLAEVQAVEGNTEPLAICRDVLGPQLGWHDRFVDHGGHSIAMARLAGQLQAAGFAVSVRDLLSHTATAADVATRGRTRAEAAESAADLSSVASVACECRDEPAAAMLSPTVFTLLQVLLLSLLYLPACVGLVAIVTVGHLDELASDAGLLNFLAAGAAVAMAAVLLPFAALVWVGVLGLLMGRRWTEAATGVYPKWSWMHLRVWWLGRRQQLVLQPLSTSLRWPMVMATVLRRLGARVGSGLQAAADAEFYGPLCLLEIGDEVAIQTGACIATCRWVGQDLHLGRVVLRNGCMLGMRAGVTAGVTVGRGSWVTPLSAALSSTADGDLVEGAAADDRSKTVRLKRPATVRPPSPSVWMREAASVGVQMLLELVLVVTPAAAIAWGTATALLTATAGRGAEVTGLAPAMLLGWLVVVAVVSTWLSVVATSLIGCVFLRLTRFGPGLRPIDSMAATLLFYRQRKMNQIQRIWSWSITGQYLRALAGLRLGRVGASECDVMFNLVPEMVRAGAEVFWSHGCYTSVLTHDARHVWLRQAEMPGDVLVGNNAVVEAGQFPSRFVLGVSTPASDVRFRRQLRSRPGRPLTVAGNPPLVFATQEPSAELAMSALPGLGHFLVRVLLNDVLRVSLLPIAEVLVYTLLVIALIGIGTTPLGAALVSLVLTEAALVMLAVATKAVLVGSRWGRDDATPFWSLRHFFYFFAQDCFFVWCRRPLRFAAGTLLANPILRKMGCRIGRRSILSSPMQAFDFNAVCIGDDCFVSGILQLHSFEDMLLKVKRFELGDTAAVNVGATIMGGAVIAAGSTIESHGLVLKDMQLAAGRFRGSPVEVVDDVEAATHASRAGGGGLDG